MHEGYVTISKCKNNNSAFSAVVAEDFPQFIINVDFLDSYENESNDVSEENSQRIERS